VRAVVLDAEFDGSAQHRPSRARVGGGAKTPGPAMVHHAIAHGVDWLVAEKCRLLIDDFAGKLPG